MDILKLRHRLLIHLLIPFLVFLGSFAALALFFSQQSGHILWENLIASTLLATMLAFFAFICMLSKWTLLLWMLGTISFVAIYLAVLLDWTSLTLDYLYGTCFVSFYCLNQHIPTWQALLIQNGFRTIFTIDIIFGAILGVRTLVALSAVYPQTKYFIGTFLLGIFTFLLSFIQRIPEVPPYTGFQYIILSLLGLFAVASFCFGFFYKKLGTRVDKFKRIYGAAVVAFIFLLPMLVPFDVASVEDQKAALYGRIGFGAFAVFCFIYLGFFAKLKSGTQTLNGNTAVTGSKNKRASH